MQLRVGTEAVDHFSTSLQVLEESINHMLIYLFFICLYFKHKCKLCGYHNILSAGFIGKIFRPQLNEGDI